MCTVDIEGEFAEPINGSSHFSLMAYVDPNPSVGYSEISSVGSITAIKPIVMAGVNLAPGEFQYLLTLASTGTLRSCYLVFGKPRWRSALIRSIGFSSKQASEYE
jgi:hypothetical protein